MAPLSPAEQVIAQREARVFLIQALPNLRGAAMLLPDGAAIPAGCACPSCTGGLQ